jgi:solute:Na+ symporter, SSS family
MALLLAGFMTIVLKLMLYSSAFIISGLFIPILAAFLLKVNSPIAAFYSIISGEMTIFSIIVLNYYVPLKLGPNRIGIATSLIVFLTLNYIPHYVQKFNYV